MTSFSVVIPVYEAAHVVGDAVASVVDQTRSPEDIIVVDDGSTDDVAGALERFAGRVRVLHREHRGPGAALNAGLAEVATEFVTFLDADDVFEPTYLAEV